MPYKDIEKKRKSQREFYKRNKSYYAQKRKEQKKKIKQFVLDYKANLKCEKCPENHISCIG